MEGRYRERRSRSRHTRSSNDRIGNRRRQTEVHMAREVISRISSWPRRWRVLVSLIIAAVVVAVVMRTVHAVHDLAFELDGNVINDNGVTLGTSDWADLFDATGATNPV